jgi:hypothetical protein
MKLTRMKLSVCLRQRQAVSCCVGAKYGTQGFAVYSQQKTACARKWHGVELGGFLLGEMSDVGANADDGGYQHDGAGGCGAAICSISS